MYPFYLGIDLHLKRTFMVLMDAKGEVIDKQRISNDDISRYLQEKVSQETYLRAALFLVALIIGTLVFSAKAISSIGGW